MTDRNLTRSRNIPKDATEERLANVNNLVSYGLVIYKRSNVPQVISVGADKYITIPAVGEYFELIGDGGNISGTVSAVNHTFQYVGGAVPSLGCASTIVLTD